MVMNCSSLVFLNGISSNYELLDHMFPAIKTLVLNIMMLKAIYTDSEPTN